jgi:hypothetical protein
MSDAGVRHATYERARQLWCGAIPRGPAQNPDFGTVAGKLLHDRGGLRPSVHSLPAVSVSAASGSSAGLKKSSVKPDTEGNDR